MTLKECDEVLPRDGLENVLITNHRNPVGVFSVGRAPELFAHHTTGIIFAHGKFTQDDLALLFPFIGREVGMHNGIGKRIKSNAPVTGRQVGMKDNTICCGVGVDPPPGIVDFTRDVTRFTRWRPLEDHVLDGMR